MPNFSAARAAPGTPLADWAMRYASEVAAVKQLIDAETAREILDEVERAIVGKREALDLVLERGEQVRPARRHDGLHSLGRQHLGDLGLAHAGLALE